MVQGDEHEEKRRRAQLDDDAMFVRAVDRYLQACYDARSAARVTELAALLSVRREYLAQRFQVTLGKPPREALREKQAEYAAILLDTTDWPTSLIAEHAAFGTVATFFRAFVRRFGCLPDAYRRRTK